jgi:hypothetical protein
MPRTTAGAGLTRRGARDLRAAARGERWARLWARARQVLTTDPTGTEADAAVAAEAGARAQARSAAALKGGLAKVAQLGAYAGGVADEALAPLWDQAPPAPASAIAAVVRAELGRTAAAAVLDLVGHAAGGRLARAGPRRGGRRRRRWRPRRWAVKVQYPRRSPRRCGLGSGRPRRFARKLAGGALRSAARSTTPRSRALHRRGLADELDYLPRGRRARAASRPTGPTIRRCIAIPAVDPRGRTSRRVLTMQRAAGVALATAGPASPRPRRARRRRAVVVRFAWGSAAGAMAGSTPIRNPGNYLVEESSLAGPAVWCLDFGCAGASSTPPGREADREHVAGPHRRGSIRRRRADPDRGWRSCGPPAPHRRARDGGTSRLGAPAGGLPLRQPDLCLDPRPTPTDLAAAVPPASSLAGGVTAARAAAAAVAAAAGVSRPCSGWSSRPSICAASCVACWASATPCAEPAQYV